MEGKRGVGRIGRLPCRSDGAVACRAWPRHCRDKERNGERTGREGRVVADEWVPVAVGKKRAGTLGGSRAGRSASWAGDLRARGSRSSRKLGQGERAACGRSGKEGKGGVARLASRPSRLLGQECEGGCAESGVGLKRKEERFFKNKSFSISKILFFS
jgi:hypothetical protein